MSTILEFILFISIFLIVYNHVIYPFIVILISEYFKKTPVAIKNDLSSQPKVSFIIAAYNEESVIKNKIDNTLSIVYPDNKLEIIVVSDGSDDSTENIVLSYKESGVLSLHDVPRAGKTSALNRAVSMASGDILVFSDANNDFSTNAVLELVKHFDDETIGAVTGAKHIYTNSSREAAVGDGLYWKYESVIKMAESTIGSITAADGEILAVRKRLYKPINPVLINDDAAITFDIIKSGHRIIYEPEAKSYEQASADLADDIDVKIRMTAGGFQTVVYEWRYLFPPRSWFSFTFISHKVLRWLTPHFMLLTLLCSAVLSSEYPIYIVLLVMQIVFYSIALYGWSIRQSNNISTAIYIPMYFTVMNIALFKGFIRFIRKNQGVNWNKAKR
ncbi:Glycosyl transferase, group 2 family protein [hydrothermal vent metagenome]|uniref:Glycosyl transferase, group 2 family protein n=1 Tax=hydrothermal vent metagenome TaxID=652676 RepID=A0A3B0YC49_9ZZZZ